MEMGKVAFSFLCRLTSVIFLTLSCHTSYSQNLFTANSKANELQDLNDRVTTLSVRVKAPVDAVIYIDNEYAGTGSVKKEVSVGEHRYHVESDCFYEKQGMVTLQKGESKSVVVELEPAYIEVYSEPSGANVFIDDNLAGTTPYMKKIKTGTHFVELKLDGYENYNERIIIREDRQNVKYKRSINTTLLPKDKRYGRLRLESSPDGAIILVDGMQYGKTHKSIELTVGRHSVCLAKDGFDDLTREIEVIEDGEEELSLVLPKELAGDGVRYKPGMTAASIDVFDTVWYDDGVFSRDAVQADFYSSIKTYRKKAKKGDANARCRLAFCYLHGFREHRKEVKDYDEAVSLLKLAAGQGHAVSQELLGSCYYYGLGVPQNNYAAIEMYKKAATQGIAGAQASLGYFYENGLGCSQNFDLAEKWYRKAAEQGHADAQCCLGIMYHDGNGVKQDYDIALGWFRKAAGQGNAVAQNRLGEIMEFGDGVPKNPYEAKKLYDLSARQGHATGQYNLGKCYEYGTGAGQDYHEAIKWYEKSADQGHVKAQYHLGLCYEHGLKNHSEAFRWYRRAAESGDGNAQRNLGLCYYCGNGTKTDYDEAAKWLAKSAEQGDTYAGYCVGLCRENQKDYAEAIKWFENAAEEGVAAAQYKLGTCYALGHGTDKDYNKAVKLYKKAAEQGNHNAMYSLGWCYENGKGVPKKDCSEAVKWYRKAADLGNANAQYSLGVCYYYGNGVPRKSQTEAVKWYRKAAEQEHPYAQYAMGMCCENGFGIERNLDNAKSWYQKAASQGNENAKKALLRLEKKRKH